jgi:hypothetical protein
MAKITGIAAMLLAVTGSAGATQGQRPNLSGTWLLVAPAEAAVQPAGQEETIAQTEATITFGHPSEGGGHQLVCGLDGQPRESSIGGIRISCRGTWEGRRLVLVERTLGAAVPPEGAERTRTLHIDENGSLVLEITPAIPDLPGAPAKLVWRKR